MPLYSYKKAPPQFGTSQYYENRAKLYENKRRIGWNITLGEILVGLYNDFHKVMSTSKIAALTIPAMLVVTGVYIIYRQVWPQVFQMIEASSGYFDDNTTALVAGDYISVKQQYSNPGAKYFAELKSHAQEENLLYQDKKSSSYKQAFELSIPSLELNNLRVNSNVDSSLESVYDESLNTGLAHFSGTSLPITDQPTSNVVIYGHSSAGDYYERTKDPVAAFSRLSKIRYGDEITVKIDGKDYKYRFIKGRIVDANDLSILEGQRGQKYLTLFTCYPNGNNSKRFVATARLIEG